MFTNQYLGVRVAVRAAPQQLLARPDRGAHRQHLRPPRAVRPTHPVVRRTPRPGEVAVREPQFTSHIARAAPHRERRVARLPLLAGPSSRVPVPVPRGTKAPSASGTTGHPALRGATTTTAAGHRAGHGARRRPRRCGPTLGSLRGAPRLPARHARGGSGHGSGPARELDVEVVRPPITPRIRPGAGATVASALPWSRSTCAPRRPR